MAARNETNQNAFDDRGLADNHLANFFFYPSQLSRGAFDVGGMGAQYFCHFKLL